MSRRQFVSVGAMASMFMLAGCLWTPRGESSQQSAPQSSSQNASTDKSQDVNDGLTLVEGGTFVMGSPGDEPWRSDDEEQHEVAVSDFYLAPKEVTQGEYQELMDTKEGDGDVAVTGVTWYDAIAYCNALSEKAGLSPAYAVDVENVTWNLLANGYRLPTEAEWEYACRAGTTGPFNLDHSVSADEANYYGYYPYEIEGNYFDQEVLEVKPGVYRGEAIAVGSFAPNAWGLYDMHGNVAEWVWDRYGAYDKSASQDPVGPNDGALRVNRGGGWNDFAKNLRSAYRASLSPASSSPSVGFRVARSASVREGSVGGGAAASAAKGGEALVVYFSWSGNTRQIVREVAGQVGVEAIELVCEKPYSSDYNTCLDEAQRDQNQQARPVLSTHIDNMDRFGTVYVGYPNWWASIPMPIATFLESYDFSGKTIRPFFSKRGGGLGQSVSAISKLVPSAQVGQGLSIYYSGGADMPQQVADWLAG